MAIASLLLTTQSMVINTTTASSQHRDDHCGDLTLERYSDAHRLRDSRRHQRAVAATAWGTKATSCLMNVVLALKSLS
jgi:hypothetical protein